MLGQTSLSPNIFLQPSGSDQNTVGKRQDVICSMSVLSDVDSDSVELRWLNEDNIITNDSRVIIIESVNGSSNFSNTVITTIIRFDPLYENDDGNYTCYAIINESEVFTSIQLQNFRSMYVVHSGYF